MYITVKYADNRSLLCNPVCSVVNLLHSIKLRTGHSVREDLQLDLSDETGLIQDLENGGREHATDHLSSHATYILMEKVPILTDNPEDHDNVKVFNYTPLLERYKELYPNFKVKIPEAQMLRLKLLKNVAKNQSPAGNMGTKSTRENRSGTTRENKSGAGSRPPRSSSRGKSK